jgi:hypothetical protein
MNYATLKKEYSIAQKDYVRLVLLPDGNFQVLADNHQSDMLDIPVTKPSRDIEEQNKSFYWLVNRI